MGDTSQLFSGSTTYEIMKALDELGHSLGKALEIAWTIDSEECATTGEMFAQYEERVGEIIEMKRTIAVML